MINKHIPTCSKATEKLNIFPLLTLPFPRSQTLPQGREERWGTIKDGNDKKYYVLL